MKQVKIPRGSTKQRLIQSLWMVYGNNGKHSTNDNHYFIQRILDSGRDMRDVYNPTPECLRAVDEILTARFIERKVNPHNNRFNFSGCVYQLPSNYSGEFIEVMTRNNQVIRAYFPNTPIEVSYKYINTIKNLLEN